MPEYQPHFSMLEHTDSDLFDDFEVACQIPQSDKVRLDRPDEPQFAIRVLSGLQFTQRDFTFTAYTRHLQYLHENGVTIPPLTYQHDRLGNVAIRAAYVTSEYPDAFEAVRDQGPYERIKDTILAGVGKYYSWCHEDPAQAVLHDLNGLWQYQYGVTAGHTHQTRSEPRWWLVDVDAGTLPIHHISALSGDYRQWRAVIEANHRLKDL